MAAASQCLRRMSVDEFSAPPVARSVGGGDQDTVFTFPVEASPSVAYETGRLCVHTKRAVELYSPHGDMPSSPSQPQRRRRMPLWKRRERRRLERQAVAFTRGFLASAPPQPQPSAAPGFGRRASLVIVEPPTSPAEEKKEKSQGDSPAVRSKKNKKGKKGKSKAKSKGRKAKRGKKVAVRRRSVRQRSVEKAVRRVAEALDKKEERAHQNKGFWAVEPESPIEEALQDVDWASLDMWLPDLSAEEDA